MQILADYAVPGAKRQDHDFKDKSFARINHNLWAIEVDGNNHAETMFNIIKDLQNLVSLSARHFIFALTEENKNYCSWVSDELDSFLGLD